MIIKMQTTQTTQMSGRTADKFIEEFKNWQLQSGVKEDRLLIEWFMAALPSTLHNKILQLETPPATIEKWYEVASRLDNNWRKFRAITSRLRSDTDPAKKKMKFPS